MSIPRQLVKSFEIIKNCKLVVSKDPTEDNLKEFGKAMNNSIPDDSNQISYMIYKFMRGMYLKDKPKFIKYINEMHHYESMILWTDYDDILNYFGLTGIVFLGWNKSVNKYQAAKIDLTKKKEVKLSNNYDSNLNQFKFPDVNNLHDPNIVVSKKTTKKDLLKDSSVESVQENAVNKIEQKDDYDLIYNRIAQLQVESKVLE